MIGQSKYKSQALRRTGVASSANLNHLICCGTGPNIGRISFFTNFPLIHLVCINTEFNSFRVNSDFVDRHRFRA